jgi:hypothetical protein
MTVIEKAIELETNLHQLTVQQLDILLAGELGELCAAQMFVARTRQAVRTVLNSINMMVRASTRAHVHSRCNTARKVDS